jgi:hypothetical protein
MARHLHRLGRYVGLHQVRRLIGKMGLTPIYQKRMTSLPHSQYPAYTYDVS